MHSDLFSIVANKRQPDGIVAQSFGIRTWDEQLASTFSFQHAKANASMKSELECYWDFEFPQEITANPLDWYRVSTNINAWPN